jgi:hypothetical protein
MPYIGRSTDGFGVRNRFLYLASASDTSVSGADANGATLTFTDGAYVDVYLNGVLLKAGTDYNTNTANTIASLSAMAANDEVTVVVYDVFTVGDMVSATSGGTFVGAVTLGGNTTLAAASNSTATHTMGTDNKLFFRDAAISINSSADGQLDIDADTEVEITTTTLDLNGALDVSGASTLTGNVALGGTLDMNGGELILDADADTSITADTDDQIDIKVAGSDLAHITSTYAKLRGATPLVFGENNSTGTYQSISGEVGANNLLLRSYQSLTFKNGTSGSSLTDGTTAFNIDANGHVTMPLQPAFITHNNSNNSRTFSSADTYEALIFNVETIDKNSDFASSTFTAPVDGTYFVASHQMFNASSSGEIRHDLAIYINSTLTLYKQGKGDNYTIAKSMNIVGLLDLDANDTVKVYARVSNTKGRIYLAQTTSTFHGYLVA